MTLTEDNLVNWLQQYCHLSKQQIPIGIGDDMAQVNVGEQGSVLITTDMLLDGVHFDLSTATLQQIEYKAMAVNLSDCAAMATEPLAAVVSVALPKSLSESELKKLHQGMVEAGNPFNCPLVGGDTTCWHFQAPLVINVTMISRPALHCVPVKRSTAQVGDLICVTGTLGGSLSGRHLSFIPRVHEALELTRLVSIHAMMDLSDGLSTDLPRLCRASGVGAHINAVNLPLSDAARTQKNPVNAALNDGEDFELLFSLSPANYAKLVKHWSLPIPITTIGEITPCLDLIISRGNGPDEMLKPGGFDHFSRQYSE